MITDTKEKEIGQLLTTAHNSFEKGLKARAYFKVHDRAISEDLVQHTFMKTWSYLLKGGKIDMMKAFLYHILNNLIIDEYRKRKTTSLDFLEEKGFEPSVDNSERMINFIDGKSAILLIERLPETYRKIMKLRYVKDLSIKETSVIMGQSRNVVTVKLHRGIEKLKKIYLIKLCNNSISSATHHPGEQANP